MRNRTENGRVLLKMMKSRMTSSVPKALSTHVVCHGCWRGGRGPSIDELECKLYVSSTKSVVCIAWQKKAWTLTSMSSKFRLHDYTKVAMVWNVRKKSGLGHSPEHEGTNCLPVEMLRIMIMSPGQKRTSKHQFGCVFLLTYLPTRNPSYVLTTRLDCW